MNNNLHGLTIASGIVICYLANGEGSPADQKQRLKQQCRYKREHCLSSPQDRIRGEKIVEKDNWVALQWISLVSLTLGEMRIPLFI